MQKKIIALAIAAAFSAPAFADTANVNVYGYLNASVDMTNNGRAADSSGTTKVSSNSSHIGFKGSEDLGDGMKAIWQVESAIAIDGSGTVAASSATAGGAAATTGSVLASRNTFIGLSGDFGTVTVGRQDTPYKTSTRSMDLFGNTLADNRSLMGGGHDTRATDAIAYTSPKFADSMTVVVAYVPGAENSSATTDDKGNAVSAAAMYGQGPISAVLAYQSVKYGTASTGQYATSATAPAAAGDSYKATKAGVGYTMDALGVNAVLEKISNTSSSLNRTNIYLSGKFDISTGNTVKVAYTMAGKINDVEDTQATQFSIGFDHAMSKRTTTYVQYTKLSNKLGVAYALNPSPETTGGIAAVTTGESTPSALSIGMVHKF